MVWISFRDIIGNPLQIVLNNPELCEIVRHSRICPVEGVGLNLYMFRFLLLVLGIKISGETVSQCLIVDRTITQLTCR